MCVTTTKERGNKLHGTFRLYFVFCSEQLTDLRTVRYRVPTNGALTFSGEGMEIHDASAFLGSLSIDRIACINNQYCIPVHY